MPRPVNHRESTGSSGITGVSGTTAAAAGGSSGTNYSNNRPRPRIRSRDTASSNSNNTTNRGVTLGPLMSVHSNRRSQSDATVNAGNVFPISPPSFNININTGSNSIGSSSYSSQRHPRGPLHLNFHNDFAYPAPGEAKMNSNINSNGNNNHNSNTNNNTKSLLPIWALAAVSSNLIDHSTKATGVSTTFRMNRVGTNTNTHATSAFAGNRSGHNRNNNHQRKDHEYEYEYDSKTKSSASKTATSSSSSSNNVKTWIRSGNKWIITNPQNRLNDKPSNKSSPTSHCSTNPNTATGTSSNAYANASSKKDPTAVSSYGTSFNSTSSSSYLNNHAPYATSTAVAATNITNNTHNHPSSPQSSTQKPSSFAGSSTTGLYTRQRMTQTPGGFSYMPALYLNQKQNQNHPHRNIINDNVMNTGGGGGGAGISSSASMGITGSSFAFGADRKQRFQSSYLLNAATKHGSGSSAFKNLTEEELMTWKEQTQMMQNVNVNKNVNVHGNKDDEHGIGSNVDRDDGAENMDGNLSRATSSGNGSFHIRMQSSSGYDSEREERLREWKEQFVQKFIRDEGDGKAKTNAKTKPQKVHSSRVIPNLLGGFTGTTTAASGMGMSGNSNSNYGNRNIFTGMGKSDSNINVNANINTNTNTNTGAKSTVQSRPMNLFWRRRSRSLDSDCDSEVNAKQKRLMEWKEEQYRRSAMFANEPTDAATNDNSLNSNTVDFTSSMNLEQVILTDADPAMLDMDGSIRSKDSFDTGCDSSYYNDRLKEWKEAQYKSYGTAPRDKKDAIEKTSPFRPVPHKRNKSVPAYEDHSNTDEYDSDTSRRQRLKEWKQQFAHGDSNASSADVGGVQKDIQDLNIDALPGIKKVDSDNSDQHSQVPLETIHSSVLKKSRRGRKVPGGGLFPVTSPQRKNNDADFVSFQSPIRNDHALLHVVSPKRASLPPLTPPRLAKPDADAVLTPMATNNTIPDRKESQDALSKPTNNKAKPTMDGGNSYMVAKAAKFLLGLSPSADEDGPVSPTGDCLSSALVLNSPCKGISSFQYDQTFEQIDPVWNSPVGTASPLHFPSAFNLWNRKRENDDPSVQGDDRSFLPISESYALNSLQSSSMDSPALPTWDNCLYVRAEGARSGRICLTPTHLVFVYEDDVSDSLLAQYGWHRDQIDDMLLEMKSPSSRGATPVNVKLDDSGDGEGVELIGAGDKSVNFMELLEDGFENSKERASLGKDRHENLMDDMDVSECMDYNCNNSSLGSSLYNQSIKLNKRGSATAASPLTADERQKDTFMDEVPPISLSSSSLDSLIDEDQSKDNSFSNEDVVNNCIIRAINEEAHLRLQEDGRTMSFAGLDRSEETNSTHEQDYTLFGSQTNISSFSDADMDIDPNQERNLYISGEADLKRKYIGIKWPLSKLSEIFDRRYMMKEVGLEIFAPSSSQLTTSSLRQATTASISTTGTNSADEIDVPLGPMSPSSIFLVIPGFVGKGRFHRKLVPRRDSFVETLKGSASNLNDAHWHGSPLSQRRWQRGRKDKIDPLSALTRAWRRGHISNFDYLLRLNAIAGRSFHDPDNYPVMPWVLSNNTSTSVPDLSDERNYRDLSKPMGALCPDRLRKFQEKFTGLCASMDTAIPPFTYGSHYSNTGGVVLHYLVRMRPFAGLHRQLQGGQFDLLPDRLFRSVSLTWDHCSRTSTAEVKEVTPQWYSYSSFLKNVHDFNLGTSASDGAAVSDVKLPPWANGDPSKFIEVMRNALESDYCSARLSQWIDLIFGYKQRGPEAEKANNVFYHLSYYDSDDLAKIRDTTLRTEIEELHIADFGSCPTQLFLVPHVSKKIDRNVQQSELSLAKGQ